MPFSRSLSLIRPGVTGEEARDQTKTLIFLGKETSLTEGERERHGTLEGIEEGTQKTKAVESNLCTAFEKGKKVESLSRNKSKMGKSNRGYQFLEEDREKGKYYHRSFIHYAAVPLFCEGIFFYLLGKGEEEKKGK